MDRTHASMAMDPLAAPSCLFLCSAHGRIHCRTRAGSRVSKRGSRRSRAPWTRTLNRDQLPPGPCAATGLRGIIEGDRSRSTFARMMMQALLVFEGF